MGEKELSIWAACGPGWHGDGWGSEGFLMLSQHEDGNLQTTPLLCYYTVDFGVTGFCSIFFFLSAANSQIKTVICAVYEIWILVSLFYIFVITGLLYSISGSSTLAHMCRKESLFIILRIGFYFYFLTAGFYTF